MNSDDSIQPSLEKQGHDNWFREQVQEALDDPGPVIPHETVMREMDELIDRIALRKSNR